MWKSLKNHERIGYIIKKPDICIPFSTGCSAVRLAHLLWEQGVVSSNPTTPTMKYRLMAVFFYALSEISVGDSDIIS